MVTECPTCGARVLDVGLIMPFNPDHTVHSECYFATHTMVEV